MTDFGKTGPGLLALTEEVTAAALAADVQAREVQQVFYGKGDGHAMGDNLFYGYYFLLTAAHLLHLVLVMIGMTVVWKISRRPALTAKDMRNVEAFGATGTRSTCCGSCSSR